MGKKGPQRTPTKKLQNRGSWLAKERSEHEPVRLVGDWSAPADLDDRSRACWESEMPKLVKLGIISTTDLLCFRAYCETWADYLRCHFDQVGQRIKLRNDLFKFASHFGLTPSTRSNIKADKNNDSSGKNQYFRVS
jgi:phage terminase small subunit